MRSHRLVAVGLTTLPSCTRRQPRVAFESEPRQRSTMQPGSRSDPITTSCRSGAAGGSQVDSSGSANRGDNVADSSIVGHITEGGCKRLVQKLPRLILRSIAGGIGVEQQQLESYRNCIRRRPQLRSLRCRLERGTVYAQTKDGQSPALLNGNRGSAPCEVCSPSLLWRLLGRRNLTQISACHPQQPPTGIRPSRASPYWRPRARDPPPQRQPPALHEKG